MAHKRGLRTTFFVRWLLWHAVLLIRPDSVQARYHLGNAYAHRGLTERAEKVWQRLLTTAPRHAPTLRNLTALLLSANRHGEAVDLLRAWCQAESGAPEPPLRLGFSLEQLGKTEEALAAYLVAVKLAPGGADVHERLARLYARFKQWPEALAHAATWTALAGESHESLVLLGQAHLSCGSSEQARACWERALKLRPDEQLQEAVNRLPKPRQPRTPEPHGGPM